MRRRFLLRFEQAENENDPDERRALLTFVIVGAGPTGVELAGTMIEIARNSAPRVFRHIESGDARVVLVEGEDRVLPAMSEQSSRSAQRQLERLGHGAVAAPRLLEGGGGDRGEERAHDLGGA